MKFLIVVLSMIFSINIQAETVSRHSGILENKETLDAHYGKGVEQLEVKMDRVRLAHSDLLIPGMDYSVKVQLDLKEEVLKLNFIFKPKCPIGAVCIISPILSYIKLPIEEVHVDYCQGIDFIARGKNPIGEEEEIVITDNSYNPCGRKALFPPTMVALKTIKKSNESLNESGEEVRSNFSGSRLMSAN